VSGVTYDSGALIAAERGSREMWALHRRLLERRLLPTVSTVVLGQAWRGSRQVQLSRLLRGCRVEPFSEPQARSAGEALAASNGSDLVDAAVAVTALACGDLVVTSDPDDLSHIASALGRRLELRVV
jgi:predicted nucleic acid-binding protein